MWASAPHFFWQRHSDHPPAFAIAAAGAGPPCAVAIATPPPRGDLLTATAQAVCTPLQLPTPGIVRSPPAAGAVFL